MVQQEIDEGFQQGLQDVLGELTKIASAKDYLPETKKKESGFKKGLKSGATIGGGLGVLTGLALPKGLRGPAVAGLGLAGAVPGAMMGGTAGLAVDHLK